MYRSLDPGEIIKTLERLARRIDERFPGSGLHAVSRELLSIAREAKERAERIEAPIRWLRAVVLVLVAALVAAAFAALLAHEMPRSGLALPDFIQVLEAGLNDVVLIGAAVFFLVTFESRVKRARALQAVHELRSIAHVIDMHQLVKDPGVLAMPALRTASSPQRYLDRYLLTRYLDYCSELLSLTGKVAAVYVRSFNDPVALAAVNEVEGLITGLSGKIWQKIMILNQYEEGEDTPSA